MADKISYAVRPDGQPFDEIRIRIVPRFKDSEVSGSEWRISTVIDFYRKGQVKYTTACGGRIEYGAGLVYARLMEAQDNGKAYFASDGVHCDQEGCSQKAVYLMRLKRRFCVGGGNCGQEKTNYGTSDHRCFCEVHKRRGDKDREDNDDNYELVRRFNPSGDEKSELYNEWLHTLVDLGHQKNIVLDRVDEELIESYYLKNKTPEDALETYIKAISIKRRPV